MPRTTIDFDPDLLQEIKIQAAREGISCRRLVNRLLRAALRTLRHPDRPQPLPSFDMGQPAVDVNDREALHRVMDTHRS